MAIAQFELVLPFLNAIFFSISVVSFCDMAIRTKGSSRAPNPTTLVTTWLKSTRTR